MLLAFPPEIIWKVTYYIIYYLSKCYYLISTLHYLITTCYYLISTLYYLISTLYTRCYLIGTCSGYKIWMFGNSERFIVTTILHHAVTTGQFIVTTLL